MPQPPINLQAIENKIIQKQADRTEVIIAEVSGPNAAEMAHLFASSFQLLRLLKKSESLLRQEHRLVSDQLDWLLQDIRHTLRVAQDPLATQKRCETTEEDCKYTPAHGSRFCEYHLFDILSERACGVRDCPRIVGLHVLEFSSLLCLGHARKAVTERGVDLVHWIATQPPGPPAPTEPGTAPIPGLGDALTRSGLPAEQDPEQVEAALFQTGLPREPVPPCCIAGDCERPRAEGRVWCAAHAIELDKEPGHRF